MSARLRTECLLFRLLLMICIYLGCSDLSQTVSAASPSPTKNGLVLWLDAGDAGGGNQPARGSTSSSRLAEWKDKSGQRNHVRQGVVERQPALVLDALGGRSVVRFDGSALDRDVLSGFRAGEQPFQVFLVMRAAPGGPENPRVVDLPTIGGGNSRKGKYSSKRTGFWLGHQGFEGAIGKMRLGVHVGDEAQSRTVSWNGKPHLVETVYAGNQRWTIYQDGKASGRGRFEGDKTFLGFDGGAKLALGQHFGMTQSNTYFRGDLAEVLIYNRVLTFEEQNQVGHYLADKYGIATAYTEKAAAVPQFEADILPILASRCADCHGKSDPEASLRLTSLTEMMRGGDGGPAIQRGRANNSLLFQMISTNEMPPQDEAKPLTDGEIELVRHWIAAGAPAKEKVDLAATRASTTSDHWAFQKLAPPAVPHVAHGKQVRTDVDAFVLAQLEKKGLRFSSIADRTTLIRRASLDLTGLLPTPGDVELFLADQRDDAWERLLNRLLESPHFGERWGRHWLDAAGYSDTLALDNDAGIIKVSSGKWRYRDYVVRAFNEDRPLAQFLTEQLAGDELVDWRASPTITPSIHEKLVATGFLRCAADFTDENELNTLAVRFGVLHQTGEILANNLLGLTLQCAKCHNHKYEPIQQRDYYRFSAILAPALNPKQWLQPTSRQLSGLSKIEKADVDRQLQQYTQQQTQLRNKVRKRLVDGKLKQLPEQIREDVRIAIQTKAKARTEVQRYLAARFEKRLGVSNNEVMKVMTEDERQRDNICTKQIGILNQRVRAAGNIQAVYDTGPPMPTYVLRRGDYEKPGAEVQPGLLQVLSDIGTSASAVNSAGKTSGRRLRLVRQLTDWNSPAGGLVVRVRVNRVWQRLFGKGIVETSDNLGVSGAKPTHPGLLEWLAVRFVKNNGRLKPMLKLLMTSTVYRQSATSTSEIAERQGQKSEANPRRVDPGNVLLWRQRLRRLESEIIRDAMLSASGRLDLTIGGPPIMIKTRPDGMVVEVHSQKKASPKDKKATLQAKWRRSLYVLARRNYNLSILAAFDQPMVNGSCLRRDTSAVATQSLMMLNDQFVLEQSEHIATRVERESPDAKPAKQIDTAFRLILVRPAGKDETAWCTHTYAKHVKTNVAAKLSDPQARHRALAHICHMLLNTSEFLYVQ